MIFSPESARSGPMCVSLWNNNQNQVMNSTYDDMPETTPPVCHTNPKDPGTHEIFGLHVMTFFDPPVGTPMH
jgi:hypothetical protein